MSWLKGRHSISFGGEIRRAYNATLPKTWEVLSTTFATVNKHFSFLASYTYSKSLDYKSLSTSESYIIPNAGPSEFEARHRFVLSGFYELPFKANRLVAGWQLGIVTQAQTGNPLNPTLAIGQDREFSYCETRRSCSRARLLSSVPASPNI